MAPALVALTTDPGFDELPAWSPNGSKIAFASQAGDVADIWVIDADRSDPVQLTTVTADDFAPVWSPDGSQIAFLRNRSGVRELYVMDSDGTAQRSLLPGIVAFAPSWQAR
jgi:TolB protein